MSSIRMPRTRALPDIAMYNTTSSVREEPVEITRERERERERDSNELMGN